MLFLIMFKIKIKNIKKENDDYVFKENAVIKFEALEDIHIQFNAYTHDTIEITLNDTTHFIDDNILYSTKLLKNQILEMKGSNVIVQLKNIVSKPLDAEENISIEHIFVINLKKDIERKNKMIEIFNKNNIHNYEFLQAIDGDECEKEYTKIKMKGSKIKTRGHFGCLKSHLNAIELSKLRNYKNILILEDDVIFDNLIETLNKITVPKTNIIYLGGIGDSKKIFNNHYAYARNIMGCYAYVIFNTYYDEIIELYKSYQHCIDIMLYKIQHFNNFIILKDIIKTNLDNSNTSNKSQKFLNYFNKTRENIKAIKYIDINKIKLKIIFNLFDVKIDKLIKNKYVVFIKDYYFISNDVYENTLDKSTPWLFYAKTTIHETLKNIIENAKYVIFDSLNFYGVYFKYFNDSNFRVIVNVQ